jgi:hypothetical protein
VQQEKAFLSDNPERSWISSLLRDKGPETRTETNAGLKISSEQVFLLFGSHMSYG